MSNGEKWQGVRGIENSSVISSKFDRNENPDWDTDALLGVLDGVFEKLH